MLRDKDSSAIVAVRDLDRAKEFYEGTLGLVALGGTLPGVLSFKTGKTVLTVYRSEFAGTNRANAVTWDVGEEIDAITQELKAKGVEFEHYEDLGELDGDVHVAGTMRLAWFKDPDGNLLHLLSG